MPIARCARSSPSHQDGRTDLNVNLINTASRRNADAARSVVIPPHTLLPSLHPSIPSHSNTPYFAFPLLAIVCNAFKLDACRSRTHRGEIAILFFTRHARLLFRLPLGINRRLGIRWWRTTPLQRGAHVQAATG